MLLVWDECVLGNWKIGCLYIITQKNNTVAVNRIIHYFFFLI